MNRTLTEEILDHMDPADPRAARSRHDLKLIDGFLGNSRWILRSLRPWNAGRESIVELGAGEGALCRRILHAHPQREIIGLDRIARPSDLPRSIRWVSGDFLGTLPDVRAGVCCGSLILHHFDAVGLRRLGQEFRRFSFLLFSEPYRGVLPLCLAALASPLAGDVTRHDMPASIRAGFRRGELAQLLGLDPATWTISEQVTRRGSIRFSARRT